MSVLISTKNYLSFESSTTHTQIPIGFRLAYSFDGDANGVFYYLGSNGNTTAWSNPMTLGKIIVVGKTTQQGTPNLLVDRATSQYHTTNAIGSYVGVDLGEKRSLVLETYLLRNRVEAVESIRNWKLQGSNNAGPLVGDFDVADWEDVDERISDATLAAANAYGHFICNKANARAFRYFRLFQTGPTSNGNNFLCLGEIELYGVLRDNS